ncbi:MAG: hypothetical protein WC442_00135 [Candidatus Omnitrophota bacterium]
MTVKDLYFRRNPIFLPVMNYFTKDEQSAMLAEFNDFDRQFSHITYKNIVSEWEKK